MENKSLTPSHELSFSSDLSLDDNLRFIFNAQFAKYLVSQRKKLRLTQKELAQKSKVDRVTIAKIETCQKLVGMETALKLLYALNSKIQFIEFTTEN